MNKDNEKYKNEMKTKRKGDREIEIGKGDQKKSMN